MPKKLVVLGFVFLSLLAVSLLLVWQGRPEAKHVSPLGKVDPAKISKLIVNNNVSQITIERQHNYWVMTEPVKDSADRRGVDYMLQALEKFTIGSLVSENKDRYSQFQLDPQQAVRVRVFQEGKSTPDLDAYMGKQAATYSDCYVRFEGKDGVFIASQLPTYYFRRSANDLRLQSPVPIDLDQMEGFSVAAKGVSFSLTRSSSTWNDDMTKKPVDAAWVRTLQDKMKLWTAVGFAKGDEKPDVTGFDHPYLKLVYTGPDSNKKSLSFGNLQKGIDPKAPGRRYAAGEGREAVLIVNAVPVDDFLNEAKKPH
jgi:hypothetical protein